MTYGSQCCFSRPISFLIFMVVVWSCFKKLSDSVMRSLYNLIIAFSQSSASDFKIVTKVSTNDERTKLCSNYTRNFI